MGLFNLRFWMWKLWSSTSEVAIKFWIYEHHISALMDSIILNPSWPNIEETFHRSRAVVSCAYDCPGMDLVAMADLPTSCSSRTMLVDIWKPASSPSPSSPGQFCLTRARTKVVVQQSQRLYAPPVLRKFVVCEYPNHGSHCALIWRLRQRDTNSTYRWSRR